VINNKNHTKAQFTHNIFAQNIEIKRYFNKKIDVDIFHPILFFLCELKIFIFGQLCLLKPSLKIFLNVPTYNILKKKISIYPFSQYCVKKYCVWRDVGLKVLNRYLTQAVLFCNFQLKIWCFKFWCFISRHACKESEANIDNYQCL